MANEDLLLRQMPHSLEGEQAVLGSMLIDEGCVKDVMDKLVPSDFYLRPSERASSQTSVGRSLRPTPVVAYVRRQTLLMSVVGHNLRQIRGDA